MQYPNLPGYRIEKVLGRGGQATVYLAMQEKIQRQVALKIISDPGASKRAYAVRFVREARIIAKLSHRHIVSVYDVGQHNGTLYIAMEYLNRGDLKNLMQSPVPLERSATIVREVASALHYASEKGFIHRDIKPANVLLSENGSAVVSDFGIARPTNAGTQITIAGSVLGTPAYMSPEQARGKPLERRSDIYSLGVILFELLEGRLPYTADSAIGIAHEHVFSSIPTLREDLEAFQPVIDRALAKNADDRFSCGEAFIVALDRALEIHMHRLNSDPNASDRTLYTRPKKGLVNDGIERKTKNSESRKQGVKYRTAAQAGKVALGFMCGATIVSGLWAINDASYAPTAEVTPKVSSVKDQTVFNLVQQGKAALLDQRLHSPLDDNAQFFFTTALAWDPQNQEAISGVRDLLENYLAESKAHITAGDSAAASAGLDRITQIAFYLDDAELLGQQQELRALVFQTEQHQARREEKATLIATSIEQANKAMRENRYKTVDGDDAFSRFQAVLQIDPENKLALGGIRAVASSYLNRAQKAAIVKDYAKARSLIAIAYQVDLTHPEGKSTYKLIADLERSDRQLATNSAKTQNPQSTKQLIARQKKKDAEQADRIRRFLAEARLISGVSGTQDSLIENVEKIYQQVLSIDPLNAEAWDGIKAIGNEYAALAETEMKIGALDKADVFLSRGQRLMPGNRRLQKLRNILINEVEQGVQADDARTFRELELSRMLSTGKDQASLREAESSFESNSAASS